MRLVAFGLSWCTAGNHAATDAYEYGDIGSWCSQHPCPSGPLEGPIPGFCDGGRIHFAKDGGYWMPRFEKWACRRHLAAILKEAINRGLWGNA